jgi:hypothetical protein
MLGENEAHSIGGWIVTDLETAATNDEGLFPADYVAPPSSAPFEPLFPVDDEPAADWISRAMKGIQRMHWDENDRARVAQSLF